MKHNKKRNTAFIYETLARELTKAIVAKNLGRKEKVYDILKEFFSRGSALGEELQLYRVLLETQNIQTKVAERLVEETKAARSRLDENAIFDAQSQLIAAINKGLGADVWGNFIPNFKALASVNGIFGSKTGVKKRVLFEQAIVDRMSKPLVVQKQTQLEPLDSLSYNSFIKKFNSKYTELLQEQKDLLNRYVTTFTDGGLELKIYLNEEISRLKETLASTGSDDVEPLIAEKIDGVLEYLEGFRHRDFEDIDLEKVLKTQELVREISR